MTGATSLEPLKGGCSATAPFLNLPIEISRKIIIYVLSGPELLPYYRFLLPLRLVSKKWAEVIDNSPGLWIKIPLDSTEKLVKLGLSRSKGLALDIEGHDVTLSVAKRVIAEARRWQSLKLRIFGSCNDFSGLLSQSAPLLEVLDIVAPPGRYRLSVPMLNGGIPNLRVIELCRCHFPYGSPVFPNLQKLRLKEVQVHAIGALLDVLRGSPQLADLRIVSCQTPFTSFSLPPRFKLHHLQTLTLEYLSPEFLNQLVGSMEVAPSSHCTFSVQLEDTIPLKDQLALLFQRLGAPDVTSQSKTPILSLKVTEDRCYEEDDDFGIYEDVELRYSKEEGSNTCLAIRVSSLPERRFDILKFFASQLRLLGQSMPPELRFINIFTPLHTDQVISLLSSLSRALPGAHNLAFIDDTDCISEVLHHLFQQDSQTCRMFPYLKELTIQTGWHDSWSGAIVALGNASVESGGNGHLPLDTLRLRKGSIRWTSIHLLRKVVPVLLLDCVEVM